MKKNILLILVLAILSAVFATLYLYDIGQQNKSMSEKVTVIVANQRIEQGEIITSSMIKEKIVPKQYVQPKYISSIKDFYVDDKPVCIAIVPFEEGEQITMSKISSITSGFGLANTIPNDKKAITLLFNNQEINGILSSGSKVDLISIVEYETKNHQYEEASCVVAQNLLVLAVGNDIIGSAKNTKEELTVSVNIPVTLAVSMEQAQKIVLAQEKGIMKIVLRPAGDDSVTNNKTIKINDIYENAVANTKSQSAKQANSEMQKRQKELNEIINKYSQK
ncbi:MAG: Flp pilus assembly protein CpaB [Endomicrobiaceae bacterium]|nr:Flp pilus assembly protein CpaB [Endomicrobiaceae bacterium]